MVKKLKLIFGILVLSGLVAVGHSPIYANDIRVMLDGEYMDIDPAPISMDGVIYVPVRAFAEILGASVSWHERVDRSKAPEWVRCLSLEFPKNDTTGRVVRLLLWIDRDFATNEMLTFDIEASTQIVNDRVFVPLSLFVDNLRLFELYFVDDVICLTTVPELVPGSVYMMHDVMPVSELPSYYHPAEGNVYRYPENFLNMRFPEYLLDPDNGRVDFDKIPEPVVLYCRDSAHGPQRLKDYTLFEVISYEEFDGREYYVETTYKSDIFVTTEGISVGSTRSEVIEAYLLYGIVELNMENLEDYLRGITIENIMNNSNGIPVLYVDNGTPEGIEQFGGLGAWIFIFNEYDIVIAIIASAPTSG